MIARYNFCCSSPKNISISGGVWLYMSEWNFSLWVTSIAIHSCESIQCISIVNVWIFNVHTEDFCNCVNFCSIPNSILKLMWEWNFPERISLKRTGNFSEHDFIQLICSKLNILNKKLKSVFRFTTRGSSWVSPKIR